MAEWLRSLFRQRSCEACKVYEARCADHRAEIQRLTEANEDLRKHLYLAVRLVDRLPALSRETVGQSEVNLRSWPAIQAELERRHKKAVKSEDDKKQEYWEKKVAEEEAKLDAGSLS